MKHSRVELLTHSQFSPSHLLVMESVCVQYSYVYCSSITLPRAYSDPELLQRNPASSWKRSLELQGERIRGTNYLYFVPSGLCFKRQWESRCDLRGIQPEQWQIRDLWNLQQYAFGYNQKFISTVKPVYNAHSWCK